MKKIDLKKYKHLINISIIIIVSTLILSWVGYSVLNDASDTTRRELTHDEYSVLTSDIHGENGIKQDIILEAGMRLYGVNLNFHTFNRVVSGQVFLELLDEEGNIVFTASDNMHNIKDNTFLGLIFEDYVINEVDTKYTLNLYTVPETSEDKIALWKSEETKEGFNLIENGNKIEGTVALQVISSYSGDFIYGYYFVFASAIFILLILSYYLIFIKKLKIEYVFLFLSIYIGVIFAFFTPIAGGADEYVHIASSYRNSSEILGVEVFDENNNLLVRKSDEFDLDKPSNYDIFDLQNISEGLSLSGSGNEELVPVKARTANVFNLLYLTQTIGITIGRILNLGYVPMMIFARILNLIVYSVLVFFAIKIMPFYKTTFSLIALTPIPLQTAASFSYDTLVISSCFLFIATCFRLIYKEEKINIKYSVLLVALAGIIAPSKAVYVVVLALVLLIPKSKFKNNKQNILLKASVFLIGAVLWLSFNSALIISSAQNIASASKTEQVAVLEEVNVAVQEDTTAQENNNPQPESTILANGDSSVYFSFSYILNNIPSTIKLIANTIGEKTQLYIYEIFGGKLGEVIVTPINISWIYVMAVIFIILISTIQKEGFKLEFKGYHKLFSLLVILGVVGMVVLACITWTPSNYETIFGIQGRYFIPILPLVFFILVGDKIVIKNRIDDILIFSLVLVNMLILLNGFSIMALR